MILLLRRCCSIGCNAFLIFLDLLHPLVQLHHNSHFRCRQLRLIEMIFVGIRATGESELNGRLRRGIGAKECVTVQKTRHGRIHRFAVGHARQPDCIPTFTGFALGDVTFDGCEALVALNLDRVLAGIAGDPRFEFWGLSFWLDVDGRWWARFSLGHVCLSGCVLCQTQQEYL